MGGKNSTTLKCEEKSMSKKLDLLFGEQKEKGS